MGDSDAMDAMFGFGLFGLFGLLFLLILYVPLILYLLNLQRCFDAIRPEFRPPVPTALVWLTLVPGLGFLVLIAAIVLLSTALKKEDEARGSALFGDGGLAVGLAAGILGLLSWIPILGLLLALGSLVCWILHWLKVSSFRKLLAGAAPGYAAPPPVPPQHYAPPPPPSPAPAPAAYMPPPVPNVTSTVANATAPAAEEATQMFVPEPKAKLVCVVGALQGMTFPVGSGVLIGRSQEANIVVPDSQVSNRHAWVGPVNGRLVLRDLQSTNGSYLNDNLAAPVQEAELKDGDLVVLGKHNQMKFRLSFA